MKVKERKTKRKDWKSMTFSQRVGDMRVSETTHRIGVTMISIYTRSKKTDTVHKMYFNLTLVNPLTVQNRRRGIIKYHVPLSFEGTIGTVQR